MLAIAGFLVTEMIVLITGKAPWLYNAERFSSNLAASLASINVAQMSGSPAMRSKRSNSGMISGCGRLTSMTFVEVTKGDFSIAAKPESLAVPPPEFPDATTPPAPLGDRRAVDGAADAAKSSEGGAHDDLRSKVGDHAVITGEVVEVVAAEAAAVVTNVDGITVLQINDGCCWING